MESHFRTAALGLCVVLAIGACKEGIDIGKDSQGILITNLTPVTLTIVDGAPGRERVAGELLPGESRNFFDLRCPEYEVIARTPEGDAAGRHEAVCADPEVSTQQANWLVGNAQGLRILNGTAQDVAVFEVRPEGEVKVGDVEPANSLNPYFVDCPEYPIVARSSSGDLLQRTDPSCYADVDSMDREVVWTVEP